VALGPVEAAGAPTDGVAPSVGGAVGGDASDSIAAGTADGTPGSGCIAGSGAPDRPAAISAVRRVASVSWSRLRWSQSTASSRPGGCDEGDGGGCDDGAGD